MKKMRKAAPMGVRGRLLVAFLAISMFSLIAASSGLYSLSQVGGVLSRITEERVPQALSWLELSRLAERVARAAPALLAVNTEDARAKVSEDIVYQARQLEPLLQESRVYVTDEQEAAALQAARLVSSLNENLVSLDELVKKRLSIIAHYNKLTRKLLQANKVAIRTLSPGARILNAQIIEWERNSNEQDSIQLTAESAELAGSIVTLIGQQKGAALVDDIQNTLLQITTADSAENIDLLIFPLQRSLDEISKIAQTLPKRIKGRMVKQIEILENLASGPDSLAQARKDELKIIDQAEELLAVNVRLSKFLTNKIDFLVGGAKAEIVDSETQAAAVQVLNRNVLIGVVALSLASSILIVWLYVGRNLIARLTALSDSMMAIAGGNLRAPLPAAVGTDEIAGMAQALTVFRDTAVEVQDNNLREIAQARQRLVDAIDSTSEGFAFYDPNDRLELFNKQYRTLLYGDDSENVIIESGMEFEAIVRQAAELGFVRHEGDGDDDIEAHVQKRLARHRNPQESLLQRRADGRWVQISERKTEGGGTVAVYSDLTELKESERRAASANHQIMESLRYAGRIQTAMMPAREAFSSATRDHFLIWEPRDIVGGDFFWFHRMQQGYSIVVGDCTGHGVPGAFMTLISCGLLDRAFNADPDGPGQVLGGLHRELQTLLAQDRDQGETDDGLEVGICFISEDGQKLVFSGARFSLWRARNGTVEEIKGDKAGIGFRRLPPDTIYHDVTVELGEGAALYMTTDGLIDQIGGPRGRSFGKKRFSTSIAGMQDRSMAEQGSALHDELHTYQGDQVRRDDVTVLGFEPLAT